MGGSVNLFWRKFGYSVPLFPAENTWTAMMLEKDFAKLKWQETKRAVMWHDYWLSCVQVTVPFRVLVLNSVPFHGLVHTVLPHHFNLIKWQAMWDHMIHGLRPDETSTLDVLVCEQFYQHTRGCDKDWGNPCSKQFTLKYFTELRTQCSFYTKGKFDRGI